MSQRPKLIGVAKHVFPLRLLHQRRSQQHGDSTESDGNEEEDVFGPGAGPCGVDARQVVTMEVETRQHTSGDAGLLPPHQSFLVFFYDEWASAVQQVRQKFRIQLEGRGLVLVDWETSVDTQEIQRCLVVATRQLLQKTSQRFVERIRVPSATSNCAIAMTLWRPVKAADSDQVHYLDEHSTRIIVNDPTLCPPVAPTPPQTQQTRRKRRQETLETHHPAYRYCPLSRLQSGKASFYGVAINLTLPKQSNGKNKYMTVGLIDESRPRREQSVLAILFLQDLDQAPPVVFVGDVLRFHQTVIKSHQDQLQAVASPPMARYVLFREASDGSILKFHHTKTCTFDADDEKRVRQLFKWSRSAIAQDDSLPPNCPNPPIPLSKMRYAGDFCDVVVQLLQFDPPPEDGENSRLVVWDGSRGVSDPGVLTRVQSASNDMSCSQARASLPALNDDHWRQGVFMEVILHAYSIVLEKMGFMDVFKKLVNLPHDRKPWCRFRNLRVETLVHEVADAGSTNGQGGDAPDKSRQIYHQLHFGELSSLVLVPSTAYEVQERIASSLATPATTTNESNVSGNQSNTATRVQVQVVVPEYVHQIPVSSTVEIKTCTKIPNKFHCLAKVVAYEPSIVEKMVQKVNDRFVYSFKLLLEDALGDLEVIVYGDDAEYFLHGIPPGDFSQAVNSKQLLEKRLHALVELSQPVHLCIKSYRPVTTKRARQEVASTAVASNVRFRVFDTLLRV